MKYRLQFDNTVGVIVGKSNPLVDMKLRNAKYKQGRNREQDSEKSLALSPEQREELFYYGEKAFELLRTAMPDDLE